MEKGKVRTYSPDTVLEDFLRTAESESDSSKASTSEFDGSKNQRSGSRWTGFLELFRSKSKGHLTKDPLITSSLKLSKRFSRSMRETSSCVMPNPILDNGLSYFKPQWKLLTLSELQTATNNFHQENLIGKGGYAEVHKGRLRNGQFIAVKRLMRGPQDERIGDFLSELGIMAHINHPNTAKLIGYAVDGGLFLVLELSPYGSLTNMLHASKQKLEWKIRYKVAIGIAQGILYLHEGGQRRIIHRDIKAANILLTKDLEPQICDFGLAKWLPERWTHLTLGKFEGTFGCVHAKPLLKKNRIRELVDPSLGDDYNLLQMNLMVLAASLCVQQSSIKRPRISQTLQLLRGNSESLDLIRRIRKPSHWKRCYEELFNAEENKMTRGLSALSLKEQIALEVSKIV
ncbi:hypothetical protein RND71_022934 [Anisodus tanguticus]|uniref:non-specific serine/threonine protein kinase n=1 Tax=Anisodus tanguticus TaxID=243964 RepID=A0AAE1VDC9_9SOLA|nr:hypothetical protein RND71_022934 [Anisodus tanguticus]